MSEAYSTAHGHFSEGRKPCAEFVEASFRRNATSRQVHRAVGGYRGEAPPRSSGQLPRLAGGDTSGYAVVRLNENGADVASATS
jgi:hypothetical protein